MLTNEQLLLQLNSSAVRNSTIVNGEWRIPGVGIPYDWLCVQLSRPQSNNSMLDYACMSKEAFARRYEDSLSSRTRFETLDTAFWALLSVLGLSIIPLAYLLMHIFVVQKQHPIIDKIWKGQVREDDINDEFSRRLLDRRCQCTSTRCGCA